jgi:hypothetical protein
MHCMPNDIRKERMAIKSGFSSGIVSTRLANNLLLTAETG